MKKPYLLVACIFITASLIAMDDTEDDTQSIASQSDKDFIKDLKEDIFSGSNDPVFLLAALNRLATLLDDNNLDSNTKIEWFNCILRKAKALADHPNANDDDNFYHLFASILTLEPEMYRLHTTHQRDVDPGVSDHN